MRYSFLAFLVLFVFSVSGQSPLKGFNELMNALQSGKHVKMVVEYKKCQLISDNEVAEKVPDAIGGMDLDSWEYFAKGAVRNEKAFLAFSASHFIQYPKGEGYVYNYVKVKVFEDNKVKITARYVDPKSFENLMDENFFGEINDGKNGAGVSFYVNP
ncbi:MAG: VirK protein [Bacteroidales bacterium]|nr:VirK protein [Bacteroidales bacterium]MDN5328790.1 VirK protein [Bacteroidales bacterium]